MSLVGGNRKGSEYEEICDVMKRGQPEILGGVMEIGIERVQRLLCY